MTDIAEMLCQHPNPQGEIISEEFVADIEPRLSELSRSEIWQLAGMLLYLGNYAEADAVLIRRHALLGSRQAAELKAAVARSLASHEAG